VIKKINGVTLYHQVMKELLIEIEDIPIGQRIPTEKELISKYNVSRGTVRQAINELVEKNIIYKVHGSGTYKGAPKQVKSYYLFKSFTEQVLSNNQVPGISDISIEKIPASEFVASKLDLPVDYQVYKISRIRLIDNKPIGYYIAYVRHDAVNNLKAEDLDMSLIGMFEEKFNYNITINQVIYSVGTATKEISALLNLLPLSPVLKMESIGYTDNVSPLFFDVGVFSPQYSIILDIYSNIRD